MIFTTTPGYITLINSTGSDDTIVNAAVVANQFNGMSVPKDKHERLFNEMIQSGHFGCLDHCFITFKLEVPIFVARQIMRASNMNFNEKSMRYLEAEPKCYVPERFYADTKRKNLGATPEPIEDFYKDKAMLIYCNQIDEAWDAYDALLLAGVRKEQARGVLPVAMFTEFWMSGCLSDWLHFLNLRTDSHAQLETQFVANEILNRMATLYPKTITLWMKYAKGPINEHGTIQTP